MLTLLALVAVASGGVAWMLRGKSVTPSTSSPTVNETVFLPEGCERDGNSRAVRVQNRLLFEQIVYDKDGLRIPFVLIQKRQQSGDPETFYIMPDKVSVEQFSTFAQKNPGLVKDQRWNSKGLPMKGGDDSYVIRNDPKDPVLGVQVDDAYHFARWLNGNLPTTQQWDKAAGAKEENPREGPYEGTWQTMKPEEKLQIGVNRRGLGPLPVGRETKDTSPFGCRDMSGNGFEWTRNIQGGNDRTVPLEKPQLFDLVLLRGRNHFDSEPVNFKEQKRDSEPYLPPTDSPPSWIGFRVVIEP
jgi:hypothetical protein